MKFVRAATTNHSSTSAPIQNVNDSAITNILAEYFSFRNAVGENRRRTFTLMSKLETMSIHDEFQGATPKQADKPLTVYVHNIQLTQRQVRWAFRYFLSSA